MGSPFDAWSATARVLARPLAENPFRLLELEPGASASDVARAVKRLQSGRDTPRMLATGSPTRTPEQLRAAGAALEDLARAGRHTLFLPWLRRLTVNGEALPAALDALASNLRRKVKPIFLAASVAEQVLPGAQESEEPEAEPEEISGGRFFAADLDATELLGPPTWPEDKAPDDTSLLGTLGKAPGAFADALLAAARFGQGRRLHASYLRTLLAQADGGDASALRRLPQTASLFEEVANESGAQLLLGHRDFLEGKRAPARRRLALVVKDAARSDDERTRAQVLLARSTQDASGLEGLVGPEAAMARAAFCMLQGELDQAEIALAEAWTRTDARPRLAPLKALVLLARDETTAAAEVLAGSAPDAPSTRFARAWLAHAQGQFEAARGLYDATLELKADHRGAQWGRAVLAVDRQERARARAVLAPHARRDRALAAGLLDLALSDGALGEVEARLIEVEADAIVLRVQALDRLGRRSEAWALRAADESDVRDSARALLEDDRALAALRELAGLSLADPLRRRAARQAVVEALAGEGQADPDLVVERVLGRVSAEELALIDLPAHLYRAVRELRDGVPKDAIVSLRRHLDSGEDALAARLFEVLTAPAGQGFAALASLLGALLEVDAQDLEALVDAAIEADDAVFEAAVIVAALQGGAFEVGELDGGSAELRQAVALLELRHGLLTADWSLCAEALDSARHAVDGELPELERARDAITLARFPEALFSEPELALQALRLSHDDPAARLHDLAVWRHLLAIEAEDTLAPSALRELVESWCAASDARALSHPALPEEPAILEDELLTSLAALLGTVTPDRAEAARTALLELHHPLALALLARAGWAAPTPTGNMRGKRRRNV
jgi:hypothetical protein